jgi:hypothetical protein
LIISWFLGIPSTKEVSWAEGSLFIVLFLLVGVDPCLPAQGQSALSSINPCGLKDLKREREKNYTAFMDVNYVHKTIFLCVSSLQSLPQQHLQEKE